MTTIDHAVVLGGSIAGLLSAAALAPRAHRITVVDRDPLPLEGPDAQVARRGVPQGDQIHHLLMRGQERIEELLPGIGDELLALGCEKYDDVADFSQFVDGAWRMRIQSDLKVTMFRRPLFEWAIRRRVLALSNVTVVKGMAVGLLASSDGARVSGAKVRGAPGGTLAADLVVDATGRGSRSPFWIEDLGYERPVERHVRIYMGYSTWTVRLPEGALPKGLAGISASASPANPFGVAIRPCGNGLHDVAAYGMAGHYPPDDLDAMAGFFEELDSPVIADVMKKAVPASEIVPYRMPGNQRRMWEDLPRRPENLVVVGDAVTSFNPIYGQGMTMAALGAGVLGDALAEAGTLDGLAETVQARLGPLAQVAWDLAVGADSVYPQAEYENVEPPSARDRDRARAQSAAQSAEGAVRVAMRATALYMDPAYLGSPVVQETIDRWLTSGHKPAPEVTDPTDPPDVTPGVVRAADLLEPATAAGRLAG
ncbi:2-polyprenyl-6-methoxyphenol hydroxylase-like FAD-dependent oxidoreductase [Prauserella sediminis]|uniref:2-polyprenyl-6-methoxyphenol hydroxylase-like FAD-dependent oxidoreductase n=1 Tax=Prauserella sediminis TaxID=577680 RepID=A0A839XWW6_9PSEU|nr:FAD-dependent monooxygenase [Prauserella sediminis]MBB3665568.1 2-polyprenyl-6-methoxyphenol hydroxylase-like FAD-dependent oxidoreductase [Prauserella sediminis]